MADYTRQDRFQPCLLDRLRDDETSKTVERQDGFVMSMTQYRQAVLRDLAWLLNTCCLAAVEDLDDYAEVESSVLNYGVPNLAGTVGSRLNLNDLERRIAEAINRFEPRILKQGLQVQILRDENKDNHNVIKLRIEGGLWADPVPEELLVQTQVDLETGQCVVQEYHG